MINGGTDNEMTKRLLIFGINDFSEILYQSININRDKLSQEVVGFIVDDEYKKQQKFCQKEVYKYSELKTKFAYDDIEVLVAIGYSKMNQNRKKIFKRLLNDGWKIASYIDPCAIVRTDLLGVGNIIFDSVNIGVGCQLGDGNVFYPGSTLAHHCAVGNFNFFALRSSVAGRVQIGDDCFFGINCCTKDHISIADQTLVGAGCYLNHDAVCTGGGICPTEVYIDSQKQSGDSLVKRDELCIAILVSAGGSIFRKTLEIIQCFENNVRFVMISDRECKAEKIAYDYGLPLYKIYNKSKSEFSAECKSYLDGYKKIDAVITFVSRLITDELIDFYPCVNIHPALLPAFKGFKAVDQAYASRVKFLGSTLHMADREMDHGSIIAQIQAPIPDGVSHNYLLDMSFIQTVYLLLLLIDLLETKMLAIFPKAKCSLVKDLPFTDRCNPCLNNEYYLTKLKELECQRNVNVLGEHKMRVTFTKAQE